MSVLGIRKSTYDGATALQKRVVKMACETLDLGDPVTVANPSAVQYYAFDDSRISLLDVAIFGRLVATLASIPATIVTKSDLMDYIRSTLVLPKDVDLTGANPWQAVLTANGGPAFVLAADSIPSNWTRL